MPPAPKCSATTRSGRRCKRAALMSGLCSVHQGKERAEYDVRALLGIRRQPRTLADLRDLTGRVAVAVLCGDLPADRVKSFASIVPTWRRCIAESAPAAPKSPHAHKSPAQILAEIIEQVQPEAIAAASRGRLRLVVSNDAAESKGG